MSIPREMTLWLIEHDRVRDLFAWKIREGRKEIRRGLSAVPATAICAAREKVYSCQRLLSSLGIIPRLVMPQWIQKSPGLAEGTIYKERHL